MSNCSPISCNPFSIFLRYNRRAAVELTDILEIHTLELTKIPQTPDANDVYLWHWLRFFSAETKEELDMVATASPAIHKATARVLKLSKDERARLLYEYEAKARDYELARIHGAVTEIARNLLKRNRPIAEIAEDTGLSHDEIEKLRE